MAVAKQESDKQQQSLPKRILAVSQREHGIFEPGFIETRLVTAR